MRHKITCAVAVSALLLSVGMTFGQAKTAAEDLNRTVTYLLDFVTKSDCTFIRNGKSYPPKEASEHMKGKYEHFKKEIKTAEDFIRLAASKSLVSGQPYLVKTNDGKEIECATWLGKILDDYRKSRKDLRERLSSALQRTPALFTGFDVLTFDVSRL